MSTYKDQLDNAAPTVIITPTAISLEKVGDKFRGLFLGMKTFEKVDRKSGEVVIMPVAHFYDGQGVRFNMGAQLTRAASILKPGISVEITLTELKANDKGGKTKIYSIAPLNIPIVNLEEMFGGVLRLEAPAASRALPPSPDWRDFPEFEEGEAENEVSTAYDPAVDLPATKAEFNVWAAAHHINGKETRAELGTDLDGWIKSGHTVTAAAKQIAAVLGPR